MRHQPVCSGEGRGDQAHTHFGCFPSAPAATMLLSVGGEVAYTLLGWAMMRSSANWISPICAGLAAESSIDEGSCGWVRDDRRARSDDGWR